jgi:hypothetical protein
MKTYKKNVTMKMLADVTYHWSKRNKKICKGCDRYKSGDDSKIRKWYRWNRNGGLMWHWDDEGWQAETDCADSLCPFSLEHMVAESLTGRKPK